MAALYKVILFNCQFLFCFGCFFIRFLSVVIFLSYIPVEPKFDTYGTLAVPAVFIGKRGMDVEILACVVVESYLVLAPRSAVIYSERVEFAFCTVRVYPDVSFSVKFLVTSFDPGRENPASAAAPLSSSALS